MSKPKITKLPSGLTVITDYNPKFHSVMVSVGVKSGARDEKANQTGIAHLLEHMAFKGTATRDYTQIIDLIENNGGRMNAYTSKSETVYYIKILKEKAELAIDILSDIVQNSVFPQEELEKERQVVVQEIKSYEDSAEDVLHDNFGLSCYPKHQIGKTILGTEQQVMSYQRKDLIKFVNMHYVPENMVISISGNITNAQAIKLVKKYFNKKNTNYVNVRKVPKFTPGMLLVNKTGLNQTHVIIGYEACSNQDLKLAITSKILGNILGSGMSSILFHEIREKRGLVYSIYSYSDNVQDHGLFSIYAATDNEKLEELLTVTNDIINNLQITKEQLQKTKTKLLSGLLMSMESSNSTATENLANYISRNKITEASEIKKIINSITLKDVQAIATKIFKSKSNIVVLANDSLKTIPM